MWVTSLLINDISEHIISARWKPYQGRLSAETVAVVRKLLNIKLEELLWIIFCGATTQELIAEGDRGILRMAAVLRPAVDHPRIGARYRQAEEEHDVWFLTRFERVLREPAVSIDKKVLLGPKAFLFLNWELPLLNPELDQGLIVRSVSEIRSLLEKDSDRRWSEDGVKKELTRLRLLPRAKGGMDAVAELGCISDFIEENAKPAI